MRLYTDFFQSDIIVASPLALATKLGEGPGEDGKHPQVCRGGGRWDVGHRHRVEAGLEQALWYEEQQQL